MKAPLIAHVLYITETSIGRPPLHLQDIFFIVFAHRQYIYGMFPIRCQIDVKNMALKCLWFRIDVKLTSYRRLSHVYTADDETIFNRHSDIGLLVLQKSNFYFIKFNGFRWMCWHLINTKTMQRLCLLSESDTCLNIWMGLLYIWCLLKWPCWPLEGASTYISIRLRL